LINKLPGQDIHSAGFGTLIKEMMGVAAKNRGAKLVMQQPLVMEWARRLHNEGQPSSGEKNKGAERQHDRSKRNLV